MNRTALKIAIGFVFFLSGLSGLGCQFAWTRAFGIGLGHEMPAVLAVVAAFFGGIALGAWALDGVISRSQRPGRWYAALEWVIGIWGLALAGLVPVANDFASHLIGLAPSAPRHWAAAFSIPFFALLPATVSMGATLPAMDRFVSPLMAGGRSIGALYAINTLGAVAGTLASTFLLVPAFGLTLALVLFAGLNGLCGIAIFLIESRIPEGTTRSFHQLTWKFLKFWGAHAPPRLRDDEAAPAAQARVAAGASPTALASTTPTVWRKQPVQVWGEAPQTAREARALPKPICESSGLTPLRLGISLFLTGLLGIGYEILSVRVLAEVLENTIYSFAASLSVYLLGTAIGAGVYQWLGRRIESQKLTVLLLNALAASCLLGTWTLNAAQRIYDQAREALGNDLAGGFVAETLVAASVFGLPTLLMGALFSHLTQSSRRERAGVGRALALNTLGSALAPLVFGVLLLPAVGAKWSLAALSVSYWSLLPQFRGWQFFAPILLAAVIVSLPQRLQLVKPPPAGKIVEYREGVMDSVAVVEHFDGNRSLLVNNRFTMGGTGAADAARRHAHIPLLLHGDPKRALFLGLGTGITLAGAGPHPGLTADGVELIPEIPQVLRHFEPHNALRSGLRIHVADARRFVRAGSEQYDVIVADLFHPSRDGAGALYTVEHFQAIRRRLAPGGIFCQWLPLHQLDGPMLQVIVRTYLESFPGARAFLLRFNVDTPVLGLIGSMEPVHYAPDWFERRVTDPGLANELKSVGLMDALHLFGCFVTGPEGLRAFSKGADLNTDDRPVVIFRAPSFAYRRSEAPYGQLITLLEKFPDDAGELLDGSGAGAARPFAVEVREFIRARNIYLRGLAAESDGRLADALDAYIESARLSEKFSTGYARCLTIAVQRAKSAPDEARQLLQRLAEAQPARPVAGELLKRLFSP